MHIRSADSQTAGSIHPAEIFHAQLPTGFDGPHRSESRGEAAAKRLAAHRMDVLQVALVPKQTIQLLRLLVELCFFEE